MVSEDSTCFPSCISLCGLNSLHIEDPAPVATRYGTSKQGTENKGNGQSHSNEHPNQSIFAMRCDLGEADLRQTVETRSAHALQCSEDDAANKTMVSARGLLLREACSFCGCGYEITHSCVIVVAIPQPREKPENMSQENRKIGSRPKWSESFAKPIAHPAKKSLADASPVHRRRLTELAHAYQGMIACMPKRPSTYPENLIDLWQWSPGQWTRLLCP